MNIIRRNRCFNDWKCGAQVFQSLKKTAAVFPVIGKIAAAFLFAACVAQAADVIPDNGPAAGGNAVLVTNCVPDIGDGADITNVTVCGVAAVIVDQGADWVSFIPGAGPTNGATGDIVIQSESVGETTLTGAYTYNPAGWIKNNIPASWTNVVGLPQRREYHAAVTYNGQIHVVGGYNDSTSAYATNVYRFDGTNWTEVAGLPQPRSRLGCAVFQDAIYAVGGYDGSSGKTNAYRFDGTNWTEVAGLPAARYSHGCAVLNDRLYAMGGASSFTNVYRFDGTNWTEVASLPAARYSFGCATLDDEIWVFGGYNGITNVYRFNGTTWTEAAGMKKGACNFGFTELNGWIYVVHGYSYAGDGWQTNCWKGNATGWQVVRGLSYPYNMNSACAAMGGYVYNIAGDSHETNVYRLYEEEIGVTPVTGTWTGGFQVAIYGSNLCNGADVTEVTICGVSVSSIVSQSPTQILVIAAATTTPGTGHVRVVSTSYGETVKSNVFAYIRPELRVLGTNSAVIVNGEAVSGAKGTMFRSPLVGASLTNRFTISNPGSDILRISGYTTNGTGAAAFYVTGVSTTISAGGSAYFYVTFAPAALASYDATLEFVNDSTNTPFILNLSGAAAAVSTNIGPFAGGNTVTISNGAALGNGSDITNVLVGGVKATIVDQGETWVTIVMPAASSPGVKDIVIQSASLGGSSMPAAYTYNPAGFIGDNGRWTNLRGLPQTRYYHAAASLGGYLYVVGGNYGGTQTNVLRFDGATWTNVAGLPQARQQLGCAVLNGALYAVAGYNSAAQTNAYRFDGSSWTEVAGLPQARYDLVCGVYSGALYAVGGYNSGGQTNVYRFDGTSWTEVAGLPAARYAVSCAALEDGLYVAGGYSSYTNVYRFDGTSWTEVRGLPSARYYHGSCVVSGQLYAVGGYYSYARTNLFMFQGTNWTERAGLPFGNYRLACVEYGGRMHVIGGYDGSSYRTNVLVFAPPSTGVYPDGGGLDGGETITITGANLGAGDITNVTLCGVPVSSIVSQSATQVVVVAAAGAPGLGDVRVYSVSFGETVKANAYEYQHPNLTVLGTNMTAVASDEPPDPAKGTAFGYAPIGRATTNRLYLYSGWVSVTLSGVTTGGAGAAAFRVVDPPATVPVNTFTPFDIVFDPDEMGFYEASFTIASDATNSPYIVNVSGSACSVTPFAGPAAGGNIVILTNGLLGSGDDITNFLIGSTAATGIVGQGTNWVAFVVPAGAPGLKDIIVQSESVGASLFGRCYGHNPPGKIADDIPTSWTAVNGLPSGRGSMGSATLNGRLYVVGGYNGAATTNVFAFDGTNWTQVAGLPAARYRVACATLNDRLYAVGGNATNVYCFDGTNWMQVAGAPMAIDYPAAAQRGPYMYVVCGYTNALRFDGTNWSVIAHRPQPLYYLGCGVMNDKLYVIGGYWTATVANVYRFDDPQWTEVASLPTNASCFGYAALDNKLYVVNGYAWGAGAGWRTNVFYYTEAESEYVAGLPASMDLACGVLNGTLYAIGGDTGGSYKTNVWRFYPGWRGVTPSCGSSAGGCTVTIVGSNLCDGADVTNVTLCGVSVISVESQSPTQVVVLAGAGGSGPGDVCIYSVSYGTTIKSNAFAYKTPGIQVFSSNNMLITSGEAADLEKGTAFGSVRLGRAVTNWFSVKNNGAIEMNILGWTTNGAGAAAFRVSDLPTQLLPQASANFSVVFSPDAVASYAASLEIENDAPTSPYVVNLSGSSFDVSSAAGPSAGGNTLVVTNGAALGNGADITNVTVCGVAASIVAQGQDWVEITLGAGPTNGATGDIVIQSESAGETTLPDVYTYNPAGVIEGGATITAIIGNGSYTNGTSSTGPVNIYYRSRHIQFVYTTDDLAAAGCSGPGRITSLGFKIAQAPVYAMPSYLVRMTHTTNTTMSPGFVTNNLVVCSSNENYMPVAGGFDMIPLTTPFEWNGTNNIILDVAWAQVVPSFNASGQSAYDSVSSRARHVSSDSADQRYVFTGGSAYSDLPQLRMIVEIGGEAVSPTNGGTAGGYEVTIRGRNLGDGSDITNVTLCGVSAASILSQSSTQVVIIAGAGMPAGVGDVRVYSVSFGETVGAGVFTVEEGGDVIIAAAAGAHGSIIPSGNVVVPIGGATSFVITADAYYHIGELLTNGEAVAEAVGLAVYTSVWENVAADGTVTVAFAENLATNNTPEWWLASYGWTNNFDDAAMGDQDVDRMPTWQEYVAGTDPTDAGSVLVVEPTPTLVFDREAVQTNGFGEVYTVEVYRVQSMVLGWPSATGRVYSVRYGDAISGVETPLVTHLPATPNWNSFTCEVYSVEATSRFYRVGVRLQ